MIVLHIPSQRNSPICRRCSYTRKSAHLHHIAGFCCSCCCTSKHNIYDVHDGVANTWRIFCEAFKKCIVVFFSSQKVCWCASTRQYVVVTHNVIEHEHCRQQRHLLGPCNVDRYLSMPLRVFRSTPTPQLTHTHKYTGVMTCILMATTMLSKNCCTNRIFVNAQHIHIPVGIQPQSDCNVRHARTYVSRVSNACMRGTDKREQHA